MECRAEAVTDWVVGVGACFSFAPQVLAATRDSSSSPSLELWGHNNTVVALTHSGSLYMTGSLDNTSRLYTSNGTLQCVFSGEQEGGAVNAVAMSSAFGLGITGSADGYIRMYNVTTCAFLAKVKGPHRSSITAISTNDPSTPGVFDEFPYTRFGGFDPALCLRLARGIVGQRQLGPTCLLSHRVFPQSRRPR